MRIAQRNFGAHKVHRGFMLMRHLWRHFVRVSKRISGNANTSREKRASLARFLSGKRINSTTVFFASLALYALPRVRAFSLSLSVSQEYVRVPPFSRVFSKGMV